MYFSTKPCNITQQFRKEPKKCSTLTAQIQKEGNHSDMKTGYPWSNISYVWKKRHWIFIDHKYSRPWVWIWFLRQHFSSAQQLTAVRMPELKEKVWPLALQLLFKVTSQDVHTYLVYESWYLTTQDAVATGTDKSETRKHFSNFSNIGNLFTALSQCSTLKSCSSKTQHSACCMFTISQYMSDPKNVPWWPVKRDFCMRF